MQDVEPDSRSSTFTGAHAEFQPARLVVVVEGRYSCRMCRLWRLCRVIHNLTQGTQVCTLCNSGTHMHVAHAGSWTTASFDNLSKVAHC